MNNSFLKKAAPHLIALAVIIGVMVLYFMPLFQGKVLRQQDVLQWRSTYQEIAEFEKKTGERMFWTNSIFSGMPAYLIGASYKGNFTNDILLFLQGIFKHPTDTIFLLFACFYVLLLTYRVNPWLAIVGSLAFMLSSFNFLNIDSGHVSKGNAIAFIPLVLAGLNITVHRNKILGALFTGVALSFQLAAGHLQITYYLVFIILAWLVVEVINALKEKKLMHLITCGAFLLVAALVGVGTSITGLLATEEYGKYSIRGKSELTKTPEGKSNAANTSSGLDKDYALAWSNGTMEPFTLLIPDFFGGSSSESVLDEKKSETLRALQTSGDPNANQYVQLTGRYWGDQPGTAGPIYYGAIIVFLFVLGLFVIKGIEKWWIFAAAMLAIFLSMGRNFMPLTDLFFNYFPLYNKFRSVTFILCISQTMFPLMAALALNALLDARADKKELKKKLLWALYIVGGLCLLFALAPGIFLDFLSERETNPDRNVPSWFLNALASDREGLVRADALRSLLLVALSFGAIWLFITQKVKANMLILIIGVVTVFDLWQVDKRYLNSKDFERKKAEAIVPKTAVDEQILQDPDPHYRVFNTTQDFDKDALTAYYHKSVGGYHGAKMRRYQELIEWQLAQQNMECFNMLNVKYFIVQDDSLGRFAQRNPFANGNAWFVRDIKWVSNADEEIVALNSNRNFPDSGFQSRKTAVIDKRYEDQLKGFSMAFDSAAGIRLTAYQPNKLSYEYDASTPQLCVFSEMYYDKGWNAYVDGQLTPHFRTDYVLRGMIVPQGKHTIEFRFEPEVIATGEKLAYTSSAILYGGLLIGLVFMFMKNRRNGPVKND